MSAAFKVGLITLLTVVTLLVGVIYIWQINPYSTYQLVSYFPHVGGIKIGSYVTLMGVQIGEVGDVVPEPERRRVKVILSIDKEYKLPLGSSFTIITTGLVGDKNVEVLPPANPTKVYLSAGAMVTGTPPASLDAIFVQAQDMLKSARELVEDKALRQDIKQTVHSVAMASGQMNALFRDLRGVTRGFGRLSTQTESLLAQINGATSAAIPDIRQIVGSVRRIAFNLESVSGQVNTLVHDREIFDNTKATVRNIADLTKEWNSLTQDLREIPGKTEDILDNVNDITNDIREITNDPEIKANVKSVAKNASQLTNSILNLTTPKTLSENPWKVDLRTEAMGIARVGPDLSVVPGAQVNFNLFGKLGFDFPISYFRVGLDEIGDANLVNLQAGSEIGDGLGVLRFGLVRGRIGAGSDVNLKFLEQPLTLSAELYDINSPHMRLGALQNVYGDYGLSFYWDSQFLKGINEFNLGVRWQPGSFKPAPESTAKP
jgi:phospholipid/cholesterol/gamma-HCH transport system substrate-binding protein